MRSELRKTLKPAEDRIVCESGRNELRVLFPGDPMTVRNALESAMGGLTHLRLSDDDRSTVELVLAEVLNNIVEHSYRNRPGGTIELRIAYDTSELSCTALDDGCPMPGGSVPQTHPPDPDVPLMSLAEGGFGWFLIRELSHDLTYRREGMRNRIDFRLMLGQRIQSC